MAQSQLVSSTVLYKEQKKIFFRRHLQVNGFDGGILWA